MKERNCVGYASSTTAFWHNARERTLRQSTAITHSDFLFEGAGQGCTYVLTCAFYRRIREFLIDHPSLTSGLLYHDWVVYALARAWNLPWAFDAESTLRYRQHQQNDTGARLSVQGLSTRLRRLHSGWYTNQLKQIYRLAAAAAPHNRVVERWGGIVLGPTNFRRRLQIVVFCIRGGRRRFSDKLLLMCASLLGWI